MEQLTIFFAVLASNEAVAMTTPTPAPRFRVLDRQRCSTASLDQQLPADHVARIVWDFVTALDLRALTAPIKAVEGRPGAPACRPEVLVALWLLATLEGIASARDLAERCQRDLPYQWLCGDRAINYHTLADFYSGHGDELHRQFVEHIAALRVQGLVTLQRCTLDGRKIPAAADKASAHRQPTLEKHLQEAEAHLQHLAAQRDQAATRSARQPAARQRAARERVQRLQAAVAQVKERQQQRQRAKRSDVQPEEARASESDPEAAKMKLNHGGFRLAYNVQTLTDEGSSLITSVRVTNQGSDNGLLGPAVRQLQQEQGRPPGAVLLDPGYTDAEDVAELEQAGVVVYMPPRDAAKDQRAGRDPYAPKRRDTPAVATWRQRMGTAAAQEIYRRRAAVAEWVHAQQSNHGWKQFRLRGLAKALVEALWQALAHNLRRLLALGVWGTATVRAV
jgi:transposase